MMLSRSVTGRYRPGSSLFASINSRFYTQHRLAGLWNAPLAARDDDYRASPLFQQQVRWRRKDRSSAFDKPRPPTKKQRKAYNRRKAKLYHEKEGRHSAPGSKAGYRRQFNEDTFQELLDYNKKDVDFEQQRLDYDYGDALVDDLMGNTSNITSIPTPTPRYLGHKHKAFYNRVQRKMDKYREEVQRLEEGTGEGASGPTLPSDHNISLVMRAYRDRHGTKTRPIGIAKALKHLLTDLSLPTVSFGEETYTTLLTCCRTPAEARRIMQLMREHQHPISSYSWAILVDIHAKLGDFEGCNAVLNEMVTEGVPPSLPAYTSLLAACYKVCNNGIIPHAVRDKAGKLGWERWKEMRVMGLDPDVMAYGALLRLVGARGQPERAINILQEMQVMEVKPTTLCFTSALKAVSRSQQTAIRFERGSSKKNRRREQITAHHGKLARTIVIMAENAEVEQDDGFVAALMLCAGAAGDSATAKAILLASEVRRMDHLRSIGSNEHLRRLQGKSVPSGGPLAVTRGQPAAYLLDGATSPDSDQVVTNEIVARNNDGSIAHRRKQKERYPSYEEREYGKDTRKLSALLFACSQAVDSHGLGTLWAGRESKGYLCANSLRLLTVRPEPKYHYPAIPGVSSTEVGMGSIEWREEEPEQMGKKLRRAKYLGIKQDDTAGYTMDDIDEKFYNMFKDEYVKPEDKGDFLTPMHLDMEQWKILKEAKAEGAVREKKKRGLEKRTSSIEEASYRESDEEWYFDDDAMRWKTRKRQVQSHSVMPSMESNVDNGENGSEGDMEMYFDDDLMKWTTRPKRTDHSVIPSMESNVDNGENGSEGQMEMYFDDDLMKWTTRPKRTHHSVIPSMESNVDNGENGSEGDRELYFDDDLMKWTTRPKRTQQPSTTISPVNEGEMSKTASRGSEEEFQKFFREMKEEIKESGEDVDFNEEEAREMFAIANDQDQGLDLGNNDIENDKVEHDDYGNFTPPADFETFYAEIKEQFNVSEAEARELHDYIVAQDKEDGRNESTTIDVAKREPGQNLEHGMAVLDSADTTSKRASHASNSVETSIDVWEDEPNFKVAALRQALPGLPRKRAMKLVRVFDKSLGYPSMLELVPILRENMPEHLTSGWLKRRNLRNVEYVLEQAREEDSMDVHILNGALQVKASAGSLNDALAYHEDEFDKQGLEPTVYSDRLVIQMLIRNNRLPRALAFKQKVEENGRKLDVISYGTLIEYYSNHEQLGSAMMVLKECLAIYGSPPGAKSLTKLRLLCRQHDMEKTLKIEELIGVDPMEWLRHGEANLKREMSIKGRRNIDLARNRLVQA